jgi:WD40 repeat protein
MTWLGSSMTYSIKQTINTNIHVLSILPNGCFISANNVFNLIIYNSTNGGVVKSLSGHTNVVYAVEAIETSYMASGGIDGTIRYWNYFNGINLETINVTSPIYCLKLLYNSLLASGGSDIKLWNLTTGKMTCNLTGHSGTVRAMDLLSQNILVSGDTNKVVIVWNLLTYSILYSITTTHTNAIYGLRALSSFSFATSSVDTKIEIRDLKVGSVLKLNGHTSDVNTLELYTENILISGSADMTFKFWNLSNGVLLDTVNTSYCVYVIKNLNNGWKVLDLFL